MRMLTSHENNPERPAGIMAVSGLLALAGSASLLFAILLFLHAVPLSYGSVLLQGGLEQRGPIAFLLYSVIALVLAWALWTRRAWARRLTILPAVIGVGLAFPAISSAVADVRLAAIVRESLQIMVRVVIIFYLTQEPVRQWFTKPVP